MILGIDDWAGNVITDYKPATDAGVGFAYSRLGQGQSYNNTGETGGQGDYLYKTHHEQANLAGWLHGTYWVLDPAYTWQEQLDWVIKEWPNDDDLPFWVDCELNGNLNSAQLIDLTGNMLGNLTAHYKRKPMIYTGKLWFWEANMVPAPAWQLEYDFALAQYPFLTYPRITTSWENLKAHFVPWDKWTPGLNSPIPGHTQPPAAIWQFSGDKFILPGISGPVDLCLMSEETLARIRTTPTPVPVPVPLTLEQRVTVLEAQARAHGWTL
jgi:GH25 family lysozyme M1 (1,4-beta-N-acetylmuramidase)